MPWEDCFYVNTTQGFLCHDAFDPGAFSHRGSGDYVHPALGVFLTTAALMLGPFAGLALLVYGAAGKRGLVTRSLYSLGGMLLIGAIGGIFALSMEQVSAMLPVFVAGAGVGIVAVLTQAPKRA